jgi:hypothetical protein
VAQNRSLIEGVWDNLKCLICVKSYGPNHWSIRIGINPSYRTMWPTLGVE